MSDLVIPNKCVKPYCENCIVQSTREFTDLHEQIGLAVSGDPLQISFALASLPCSNAVTRLRALLKSALLFTA